MTTGRGKVITRKWKGIGPTGRKITKVSYGYSVAIAGKQERVVKAEWSRDDARAELVKRLEEVGQGRTAPSTTTFRQLAAAYLEFKAASGKRSMREDRRIMNKRLVPAFGDLRVRDITEPVISRYHHQRIAEVSVYTVSNELSVLRHALRIGRRRGYLVQIPDFAMPSKPEGRQRYLDADEIKRLLPACATSKNPYLSAIVQLALHLGLRKEELLSLTWERCDLSTGRVTVYKTKSGRPRGVPMNADVYRILVTLEPDPDKRVGFLFRRKNGARWGQIRTAFQGALERAEIKGFRFHDLRHTCGSWLAMNGATLVEIKEILGHADVKTTLRYAHLSPGHLRGAVARLEGLTTPHETAHELHIEGKIAPSVA